MPFLEWLGKFRFAFFFNAREHATILLLQIYP
ncbi:hypothetical protein CBM2608_B140013 [Cupriavidus taiwanensis]|nr:hypothetical protein CBM2608_B140013 [Cupriavidus taiwanensis]